MILTCPNCATRYTVDDAKFPAAGRKVRCAKCTNVWFQPGPGAEPVAAMAAAAAPASAPISAPVSTPPPAAAPVVEHVAETAPSADFVPAKAEPEQAVQAQPQMGLGA